MAKIQIRRGVWETNSSSTHSLTIVSKDMYDKLNRGEGLVDRYSGEPVVDEKGELVNPATIDPKKVWNEKLGNKNCNYCTLDQFFDYFHSDLETFVQTKTINSETVVGYGYYGYS